MALSASLRALPGSGAVYKYAVNMKQNLLSKRLVVTALSILSFSVAVAEPPTETTSGKEDAAATTNASKTKTRNIRTGASIKVKATSIPAFRPGAGFKEKSSDTSASPTPVPTGTRKAELDGLKTTSEKNAKKAASSPTPKPKQKQKQKQQP